MTCRFAGAVFAFPAQPDNYYSEPIFFCLSVVIISTRRKRYEGMSSKSEDVIKNSFRVARKKCIVIRN